MSKIRPLTPAEARSSLVSRLVKVVDNARQAATQIGTRPYRCFLVWEKSPGQERGEGIPVEKGRCELLPTPKLATLDSVTFSVFHAGTIPAGSVKLTEVSLRYTADQLMGRMVPGAEHTDQIPEPWWFYYEVVEDGRGDCAPERRKFRLLSDPTRDAENVQWTLMLERMSEDNGRDGKTKYLTGQEG